MKAQDFMNQNNERSEVIAIIQQFCHDHNLDYTYNEKLFKIKLPAAESIPVTPMVSPIRRDAQIPDLNWDFGVKGIEESVDPPDQLPPATDGLDEGETPKSSGEVQS